VGYLKKSKIVSIVAYLLIVIGILPLLWSFQPINNKQTIELPAESGIFYRITLPNQVSGHVSGDFTVDSGQVNVYVLSKAQYAQYAWDLDPSSTMNKVTGAFGEFSVDLPSTATYYVAVDHEGVGVPTEQTVTISLKITGIGITYLVIGVIMVAVGGVLAVVGMRMKAKEVALMPPAPSPGSKATDVTMFDKRS
jgi:hypothetical protein